MDIISLTDKGAYRENNQDNYWAAVLDVNGEEAGVICLCDGMGGLENGELASRLVTSAVREYILKDFDFSGIIGVLERVNRKIYNMSGGDNSKLMGTTCTIVMCYMGKYNVCHIGDSRGYLFRAGKSYQITEDHSVVHKYKITKEKDPVLWNKYKNKLTKCIGVGTEIEPAFYEGDYVKGDKFVVCSDGCWHIFDDIEMTNKEISNLYDLFKVCKSHGERDNITAGVLKI